MASTGVLPFIRGIDLTMNDLQVLFSLNFGIFIAKDVWFNPSKEFLDPPPPAPSKNVHDLISN